MPSETPPRRRLSEFAMIAKLFAPLAANAKGAYGLADDAASLNVPAGEELVVTVDTIVEGVHFLSDDLADDIAKKALRVNLSDLAGKGARPIGYLLALSLPQWIDDAWLETFARGLKQDQQRYALDLLGGDTTSTPGPLTISITALGSAPAGRMLRRGGANPGDIVFVTGTIGDAGAGLAILGSEEGANLSDEEHEHLIARFCLPEPRSELGPRLIGTATAALDISDGLLADLAHIAEVSRVRIVVESGRIPLSGAYVSLAGSSVPAILDAATAGDDYEIAFTAPPSVRQAIAAISASSSVLVSEIGRVEAGDGVVLLDDAGHPILVERLGYTHF
jgi:thiamine-monophosphate kinase